MVNLPAHLPTEARRTPSRHVVRFALLLALTSLLAVGCVQRRLTVMTNPPGALIKIDDVEIGTSPVSTSFVYYGTRKIEIMKPGFETLTVLQPIRAPWYEWPGVDFFSEHFVPGEIRDDRVLRYDLQPSIPVPTDLLLNRADRLRSEGRAGTLPPPVEPLPAPPAMPSPPGALGPVFVPPGPLVPPPTAVPGPGPLDHRLPY